MFTSASDKEGPVSALYATASSSSATSRASRNQRKMVPTPIIPKGDISTARSAPMLAAPSTVVPASMRREDLQRRHGEALQELAVDDADDGRPFLQRRDQIASTDGRTKVRLWQDGLCLRDRQARSHEDDPCDSSEALLVARRPRTMRSGSKCLADQCSRPGTIHLDDRQTNFGSRQIDGDDLRQAGGLQPP